MRASRYTSPKPELFARAGANTMLVDREVHAWARVIGGYWMSAITNGVKWWAQ